MDAEKKISGLITRKSSVVNLYHTGAEPRKFDESERMTPDELASTFDILKQSLTRKKPAGIPSSGSFGK